MTKAYQALKLLKKKKKPLKEDLKKWSMFLGNEGVEKRGVWAN